MRFTFILIITSVFTVNAKVNAQKISLFFKNAPLQSVLNEMGKQSGVAFLWNQEVTKEKHLVTVNLKNSSVDEALRQIFKNLSLAYELHGKVVLIKYKKQDKVNVVAIKSTPSELNIHGRVTDSSGAPISGVSINILGTKNGTTTNEQGVYQIKANEGDRMQFSFVSYKTQVVVVGSNAEINITLLMDYALLNDVVVVGYGTQKKVDLTGAVATISGKALMSDPSPNPASIFQGRLPGLQVVQGSGQPGAEGVQLMVRGMGSYGSSNAPLIVVDGMPNAAIPTTENIASVSLLKDAASAAIYGALAANGVVLITTKRGRTGEAELVYSINVGLYQASKLPDLITNSADFMTLWNQAADHSNSPDEKYEQADIDKYRNANGNPLYPNTDWMSLIFRNAVVATHALTATGGNEKTTYNLNFNYLNQPGIVRGFNYERYSTRLNVESKLSKQIQMGVNVGATYGIAKSVNGDLFFGAFTQSPTYGPFLADGRLTKNAFPTIEYKNNINPFIYLDGFTSNTTSFNFQLNPYVRVNLNDWLMWETNGSFAMNTSRSKNFSPASRTLYNWFSGDQAEVRVGTGLVEQYISSINPVLYSTLNFNKKFAQHTFGALAGTQVQYSKTEFLGGSRTQYYSDLTQELNAGAGTINNSGTTTENAMRSYIARVNYGFMDKYLVEVNFRADGLSRFASGQRWGYFTGASGGWRFGKEKFMKNAQWLTDGKIRVSYGALGNQGSNDYPYQNVQQTQRGFYSYDNSNILLGVAPGPLVNRSITWEKTNVLDFGVDLSFIKNRLTFTFDWFKKNTTNILRAQQVAQETGFSGASPIINKGAMTNSGFEFTIDYQNKTGQLDYNVNWNFQTYNNKVTSFGAEQITTNGGYNASIIREGLPYNSFYMYMWDGIFQTQEEADNSGQTNQPKAGDLKIKDISGPTGQPDGVIDSYDKVVVDGVFPKFSTGVTINLGYKNFDFSAFLYGNYGQKLYVYGYGLEPFYQGSVPTKDWLNAWTPDNQNNSLPAVYNSQRYNSTWATYPNTWFLRDASYTRLKNVNIGWTKSITHGMLKSVRLYFAGENLLTLSSYKGLDPERTGTAGNYMTFPQNRVYSIGATFKF